MNCFKISLFKTTTNPFNTHPTHFKKHLTKQAIKNSLTTFTTTSQKMQFLSFFSLVILASTSTVLAATWGETCNPTIPNGPTCPSDLVCWTGTRALGASGRCTKLVKAGEACSKDAKLPTQCDKSSTCYNSAKEALDNNGVCRPWSTVNGPCGGKSSKSPVCPINSECKSGVCKEVAPEFRRTTV